MTTDPERVEEVAKGLTKAQRSAVAKCWMDGNEIVQGGQDDSGIATRVINSLRGKEMLAWVAPSDFYTLAIWRLNSLGLAVRAHLLAKEVRSNG